jgi:hypothetical protein
MTELVGVGAMSVDGSRSRLEYRSGAARRPGEGIDAEQAATSLTAALGKKHTFGCAQPTRGAPCDC